MSAVTIGLIVVLGLLFVAIWIIKNLYAKLITFEDWAFEVRKEISKVLNTMNFLDNKQLFEKDDEVGELWTSITNAVKKIEVFLVPEEEIKDPTDEEVPEVIDETQVVPEKDEYIIE